MERPKNYPEGYPLPKVSPDIEQLERDITLAAKRWAEVRDDNAHSKGRISHLKKDGLDNNSVNAMQQLTEATDRFVVKPYAKKLEKLVAKHPLYQWIQATKGVSAFMFGELLTFVGGGMYLIARPSSLSKFLGCHTVETKEGIRVAPKKRKGQFLGFNSRTGGWRYNLAASLMKAKHQFYYEIVYKNRKAATMKRAKQGPSECPFGQTHYEKDGKKIMKCRPLHIENDARRVMVKRFLIDLWWAYHTLVATGLVEYQAAWLKEKHGYELGHVPGQERWGEPVLP